LLGFVALAQHQHDQRADRAENKQTDDDGG